MGSNKFTLKIKFSSGVFPAKPGSSSFALTPLCCSRVAKNCKSSLLLHGFFGFVVFRLREWAPGQKMVSATASQAGPWPHMHQSMFLLLGLPRIWVLPALPCPVPRSPGRAVLQSWLPLTALLLHLPGARGGCCAPIPKHFLSVIPAVSSAVVLLTCQTCHLNVLCKPDQAVSENFAFLLCSIPQKWSCCSIPHHTAPRILSLGWLFAALVSVYKAGGMTCFQASWSLGLLFSIARTSFTFPVAQSCPWFLLLEALPPCCCSVWKPQLVPLFCVCCVFWGWKWGLIAGFVFWGFLGVIWWLFWASKILASPTIHLHRIMTWAISVGS